MSVIAYYVALNGSDQNEGSLERPFRTLERARNEVRFVKQGMKCDIHIYVRGGVYTLADTFVLGSEDSGENGYAIRYLAYPGEQPVLSGGRKLSGWQPHEKGIYACDSQGLRFRQLYAAGRRSVRARTPNAGQYFRIEEWDKDNKQIVLNGADVRALGSVDGVELIAQVYWAEAVMRLERVERSGDRAFFTVKEPESGMIFARPFPPRKNGQSYHLENSYEMLDEPGEWYLDEKQGRVYYIPREGEDPSSLGAVAPVLETLVRIQGTLDEPVRHVSFSGFVFEHTTWLRPSDYGNLNAQAGQYNVAADEQNNQYVGRPPAGFYVACAEQVRLERNVFRHMGATALDFHYGTHRCEAEGNAIVDIAGSGIMAGMFSPEDVEYHSLYNPEDKREISTADRIRNNFVARIGLDYWGSVGIAAGFVRYIEIDHNELYDMPYTGISLGWGWLSEDSALRCNSIRYNRVGRVMKLLCDGAGIYTLSKQEGTVIIGNYVHNIVKSEQAGEFPISAIYLDEGSAGMYVYGNESNYSTPRDFNLHQNGVNFIANDKKHKNEVMAYAGLQDEYRDLKAWYEYA